MAEKKTAKSTTKKTSSAPKKATPKATPEVDRYQEILEARRDMEKAQDEVAVAERQVRSARTIMSDFALRDQAVAEAQENLGVARARAADATAKFQELKYRSN